MTHELSTSSKLTRKQKLVRRALPLAVVAAATGVVGGPKAVHAIGDALAGPDTVTCNYTTQPGDTLSGVADKLHIGIDSITSATTPDGRNVNPALDPLHMPTDEVLHVRVTKEMCEQLGQQAIARRADHE